MHVYGREREQATRNKCCELGQGEALINAFSGTCGVCATAKKRATQTHTLGHLHSLSVSLDNRTNRMMMWATYAGL